MDSNKNISHQNDADRMRFISHYEMKKKIIVYNCDQYNDQKNEQ